MSFGAEVLAAAEEAWIAIVRLDAAYGDRIVPFSSILLRSESAAFSRIEQLTETAMDDLLEFAGRDDIHALLRRQDITRNVTVPSSAELLVDVVAALDRFAEASGRRARPTAP